MHERASRNTELGDRACFCVSCGWARRYMPGAASPASSCPACGEDVVSACHACGADVLSIMVVECDLCGAVLRDRLAGGVVQIRRSKRMPLVTTTPAATEATVIPAGVQTATATAALEAETTARD